MSQPAPAEVLSVSRRSPADRAGIRPGDRLARVNGRAPCDYIDYRYLVAEPRVELMVESPSGERRQVSIEKSVDEDLGVRFTQDVFDGVIACRNRCPFCFIGQLPKGLRPALYVRDDDYRLSFLHGNFITLTNLTAADRRRITRLHLSPLYVSVHATELEVRAKLFGRPTPDVVSEIRRLGRRGIEFHAQIVVCPGINDGVHLERTVADLASLYPAVRSVGVVPVGLTRHRQRTEAVRAVTRKMARNLIATIAQWQERFRRQLGSRLVFASDELYLLAGLTLPGRRHYEGFPQLGNGIGCARLFLDSVRRMAPPRPSRGLSVTLVTGEMAAPLVHALARRMIGGNVSAEVSVVRNRLLGRSVTTAGLLAGRDIARALQDRVRSDLVIVPGAAVREGEGFIDGMSVAALSERIGTPVASAATPAEARAALRRLDRGEAL